MHDICEYSAAGDSAMFISSLSVVNTYFPAPRNATVYKKQCKTLWCGVTNSSVPRCLSVTVRGGEEAEFQIQHLLHLQYIVNERRDETNQNAPIMNSDEHSSVNCRRNSDVNAQWTNQTLRLRKQRDATN